MTSMFPQACQSYYRQYRYRTVAHNGNASYWPVPGTRYSVRASYAAHGMVQYIRVPRTSTVQYWDGNGMVPYLVLRKKKIFRIHHIAFRKGLH
jgi:hypothetical protein